ncbi:uncharacterized protein LOC117182990 [Belonocnema kinseyi]|uniref:uncharacterized protein LOC117182990 n=1 Tax=Belonocnema kinseyi TaxID=2817044 RepID=UPI00143D9EC4|nr:uncharacterized protein LOC117182990 [Belonocnema kinseyi]
MRLLILIFLLYYVYSGQCEENPEDNPSDKPKEEPKAETKKVPKKICGEKNKKKCEEKRKKKGEKIPTKHLTKDEAILFCMKQIPDYVDEVGRHPAFTCANPNVHQFSFKPRKAGVTKRWCAYVSKRNKKGKILEFNCRTHSIIGEDIYMDDEEGKEGQEEIEEKIKEREKQKRKQ